MKKRLRSIVVRLSERDMAFGDGVLEESIVKMIGHRNFSVEEVQQSYRDPGVYGTEIVWKLLVRIGLPHQIEVRRKWKQRNRKHWR